MQKSIALLTFLAIPNDMLENCGVCEGEAVRDLAFLSSADPKKLYKA